MNKFEKGLIGKLAYSKKVTRKNILDESYPEGTEILTIVGEPTISTLPGTRTLNAPCVTADGEIVIRDILFWYIP